MSTITAFNHSIRDAGNLSDQKLFGSFRSLNRFSADVPSIPRSKHDDIFQNQEFENSLDAIAAIPAAQEESKTERRARHSKDKKHRKQRTHNKERSDKENSNTRDHERDRPKENKDQDRERDKDEDAMKYLNHRRERRRNKQVFHIYFNSKVD